MEPKGGFKGLWGRKSPKEKSSPEKHKNDVELGGEEELLDVFKSEAAATGVSKEELSPQASKEEVLGKGEPVKVFQTEKVKAVAPQEELNPSASKEEPSGEADVLDVFKTEKVENKDMQTMADGLEDLDMDDLLQECLDVVNQLRGNH